MRISHHGGKCCGIKVIHQLGASPEETQPPLTINGARCRKDAAGHDVSSLDNLFRGERPKEKQKDRFKAYLDFLADWRPSGMVEVSIVEKMAGGRMNYQERWVPILEKLGFKKVSEWYNSNSTNTVSCYHLIMHKGKYPYTE